MSDLTPSQKILVTGANGFLGSWVVRGLLQQNHEVTCLVRKTSDLSELQGLDCKYVYGDITDFESTLKAAQGQTAVFHLAGMISYKRRDLAKMQLINVQGTRHVIEACKVNSVQRLVHFSSVVAVGAGLKAHEVLNEDSPYNLARFGMGYFDSKREAEILVKTACDRKEIDAVIVNPSTVYGAGDALKGSRKMQIKAARGELLFYTPGGVNVVAVEDVVQGALSAWQKGRTGERYILCGENMLIKDLLGQIAAAAGHKGPSILLPSRVLILLGAIGDLFQAGFSKDNAYSSSLFHFFSNAKAQRDLDFNPRPAREALKNSVRWMQERHLLDP